MSGTACRTDDVEAGVGLEEVQWQLEGTKLQDYVLYGVPHW